MEYTLSPAVEFIRLDDDRAILAGPAARTELSGESVSLVEAALPHLRSGVTVTALADALDVPDATARALLDALADSDELVTDLHDDSWQWLSDDPDKTRSALQDATVGVLTRGGLDAPPLDAVATDTLDEPSHIDDEVAGLDCLVTATVGERRGFHETVLDAVAAADIPWLPLRLVGTDGVVGPLTIPGETACYRCYITRRIACDDDPESRLLELDRRADTETHPPYHAAARDLLVTTGRAELLSHLGGYATPLTRDGVVTIDVRTAERTESRLLKRPGCELCDPN